MMLTTKCLAVDLGFDYEPGNLYFCWWVLSPFRIRQVLATADGEAACPPDVFTSAARDTLLHTVAQLEALYLSTTHRLL